ncbi:caspase-10 isoform X1 [Onychostruthus taczanowskii]|uniref:caspase-10 isoform X1 n=1 Tax=Onychostruthus taczanowskii TaxID=356909 RepID=UPI001B800510|nr:caspase-10 isoform X1 [Onychostruthus taczanowskii]XP_041259242.1 caspase-10 isoform X1 [Onychostruthus taczanowskii]XP_041259243.1 caspase-10 isoform X1 [Onychostruthus taczanowskii]XP_041259244.1 caspase-10 isoform X1 [Onychostruthus taczanowskii]
MENDISLKFHQQLFLISENLVTEDVAALKFLCTDLLCLSKLEDVKSAADIFKLLMAQDYLNAEDTFLLAELLYRIRCHSLLEKLGYTKEKVQERLSEKGRISPYRQMLYELSENITSEMLKEIIFLLQSHLPKRWTILSALDLLTSLEKQGLLTKDNVKILEDVCMTVSPDLLETIDCYKKGRDNKAANFTQRFSELNLELHGEFSNVENESKTVKSYKMDGPHRGFCLIINNVNFNSSQRKGSCKDAEQLERVFTWLGLDVRTCTNLTSREIINLMKTWQQVKDHKDRNCFICCILSHGRSGAICGTDDRFVSIRVLMSHFTAKQCPQLAAKPKLFFIQACQGDEVQRPVYVDTDGPTPDFSVQERVSLSESIPEEADFLLGMATVDGCVSFRHVAEGSWYIQALCSKLQLLVPRGEDILSILTQVNEDVARRDSPSGTKKQMPQPAYTLRRKFIFPIPTAPPPSEQHQSFQYT